MRINRSVKRMLACTAAVVTVGQVQGQSVTVGGVFDTALSRNQGTGVGSRTGLSTGNNLASRLFFRGSEDLGGGLAASFWLEGQLVVDTGNPAGFSFQRRSTVSLSGRLGEIRLGRDVAPTYLNDYPFDPFLNRGAGTAMNYANFSSNVGGTITPLDTLRNSNSVGYFTPSYLGPWSVALQYAFGEAPSNAVNSRTGNYLGARFAYAQGPLNVGVAAGRWQQVGNAATATDRRGDLRAASIGGSYDFGVIRPMAFYGFEELTRVAPAKLTTMLIGFVVPVGVGEFRAAYSHYDLKNSPNDFNKLAVGYNHNLSKRTQLYATLAGLRNKGAATKGIGQEGLAATGSAPGGRSSGFDLGIRHLF